jgi:CRISPR-associated protein Cmr3
MKPGSGFLGQFDADLPAQLRASALMSGMGAAGRGARPVEFGNASGKLDPNWRDLRAGAYLPDTVNDGAQFWLVAIGPARIKDWKSPVTTPLPSGVTCTGRAALLGPPLVLGGLSMVVGDSRPNRTYAPAGSAWLIELSGGDAAARRAALEALHDRPSIGDPDDHCFGFGHTLLGLTKEHVEAA